MLDIKLIREKPEDIKKDLTRRPNFDTGIVDKVLEVDSKWREAKAELDSLKAEKNKESKGISEVKKSGGDIGEQVKKAKLASDAVDSKEVEVRELEEKRDKILFAIPNILDPEVPKGDDDEANVHYKFHLEKPKFSFKARTHQELCEMNDWYDIERPAKNSGARFYFLKNELMMLEMAVHNYALQKLVSKGFTVMTVPPMLRADVAKLAIPLGDFEDTIYTIQNEGDELFMIGTSEHAMATFHINELLNHKDLPILYAGYSPCYRREAGVTKDEKGIFRVHNFNKVEQFIYCSEDKSDEVHQMITENIEELFQDLGLHYQMVDICTGDIGIFATRKYDLEAWLPGQERYREMGSSSNYRDYGARNLNVRYQSDDGSIKFCHTLNNTMVATPRAIIAIIEQFQTEDGNVRIPEVLRSFFDGREFLKGK